jgi:peptide deformylase
MPSQQGFAVALLNIRLVPDPILFRKARKVAKITGQHRKLASDMVETMDEHHGVGLAANQVGVLERICVIRTPEMEEALVLVNPEIVKREGEREVEEGCLSVPGYRGMVIRSETVQARALDLNSKRFKVDAENDILAQALEHEIDHLNGIMYMDHLVAHTRLYPVKEAGEDDEFGAEHERDDEREHRHEHGQSHHPEPGRINPDFDARHRRLHDMNLDERGEGGANRPAVP